MIGEFKKKCWNYIAIEHKKNKTFEKTYLNVIILYIFYLFNLILIYLLDSNKL
jgi:hypothetical protein